LTQSINVAYNTKSEYLITPSLQADTTHVALLAWGFLDFKYSGYTINVNSYLTTYGYLCTFTICFL